MNYALIIEGLESYVTAVESNLDYYRECGDTGAEEAAIGMINDFNKEIEKYKTLMKESG